MWAAARGLWASCAGLRVLWGKRRWREPFGSLAGPAELLGLLWQQELAQEICLQNQKEVLVCRTFPGVSLDLQAIQVRIPPEGYLKEEQEGRPCVPESLKLSPLQSPDGFAVHSRSEPGGVGLEYGALQGLSDFRLLSLPHILEDKSLC